MKEHRLKTWPEYFKALAAGIKKFEIRFDDRGFSVGDTVICEEYNNGTKQYTGRELHFAIVYKCCWNDDAVMGVALKVGYCILSLEPKIQK